MIKSRVTNAITQLTNNDHKDGEFNILKDFNGNLIFIIVLDITDLDEAKDLMKERLDKIKHLQPPRTAVSIQIIHTPIHYLQIANWFGYSENEDKL